MSLNITKKKDDDDDRHSSSFTGHSPRINTDSRSIGYSRYIHCGCIACEHIRAKRIVPGTICYPALIDSSLVVGIPVWYPGTWRSTGWNNRLSCDRSYLFLCIGIIPKNDSDCGHLDPALLLQVPDNRVIVTSRRWLVT